MCGCSHCFYIHRDRNRKYWNCPDCGLVHVPSRYHLSPQEEKERYDLHNNDPENKGYMELLNSLFLPVMNRLEPGARGLDFGSGPSPVLASMFRREGFEAELFDKFYANDPSVLERTYDFITASEVVEHFENPRADLDRLYGILKPGGFLGILTGMLPEAGEFSKWHYKNDKTHVCFFSSDTFRWIGAEWGAEIEFPGDDVAIIRKMVDPVA